MDFKDFPKVELHLHLDCSLSYQIVRQLDPNVTEEEFRRDFQAPAKCTSLVDFLTRPPKQIALMQTTEQLRLVTEDLFKQLKADGVVYAEIRFAPLLHLERGLSGERVVQAVNDAAQAASSDTGIEARLILCTLRHYSSQQSLETVQLVERFQGSLVAAFDIAGDEAGYPIDPHIPAFRYAREHGISCTAHAGEAAGPQSVWETLQAFQPSRIGHGVRSAEDPRLVEHLASERIHLEVCPTSNVQTNVCDSYADHPVDRLYGEGVSLGVNTDTRTVSNITLREEYAKLHETFGWNHDHFVRCNVNAIDAAFIPDDVKVGLRNRVRQNAGENSAVD